MMGEIPYGYCQCGCGQLAKISEKKSTKVGFVKGKPRRFLKGHNLKGSNNHIWNGGKYISSHGYVRVLMPEHSRADVDGYVYEHILVCEKALGKPLPLGAEPHHINENKSDNRPSNLIVCQDRAYHLILHQRMRALKDCGHASWRKCFVCKKYDSPENLSNVQKGRAPYHSSCINAYNLISKRKRKASKELNRALDQGAMA
jgi:hypothetical protein